MDDITGQALNTAGLVDYQPGAVVSRTIIKRKAGTITLFAFDKGEGLSEHTAPFDALVQILEGEAEVVISGKKQTVEAEEMIILPADRPHSLKANAKFKMMLMMIRA